MPWKENYTISNERTVVDTDVRWPGGATLQFSVTIDLSPINGPGGITAADVSTDEAFFGTHGGLDALREVLSRHNVKATVATPGVIAEIHPEVIHKLAADGHEIAAHTWAHEDITNLDIDVERARLRQTTETVTAASGVRPVGWFSLPRPGDKYAVGSMSPHTVNLLLESRYQYLGNSLADDRPHYWVSDPEGPTSILALPYYYHFDDQFFLLFPKRGTGLEHSDALDRNWRGELAAQYRRGAMFHITIHPYAIAWPHRLLLLDRFLHAACSLPGVITLTGSQVAAHWKQTYPMSEVFQLRPSIWKDYEDSLS